MDTVDPTPAPTTDSPARQGPGWTRHAIAWHVFPLGFVGAPALCPPGDPDDPSSPAGAMAAEHRLRRLEPWLDRLIELGCNVLLLGPVFHSMSHGYDTIDYHRLDPRLGTNDDLTALIEAAHSRGVRVILDGVFNHVGIDFPAFAALGQRGPRCPEAEMFRLSWPGGPEAWEPGTAPDYERFEGQDWLPVLNHASPAVTEMVTEVMTSWCARGVDGWRLDAAYAVDPAFWTTVLPAVRAARPEVYVVGEVIHGDYARIVTDSGMDAVTQYELWQSMWHSIADSNFYELDWTLRRNEELLRTFIPLTFLGNHDTTRIAAGVGDPRRLPHAMALLATLPGTPVIYYGDEEGMVAVKEERLGGDDTIRPAFPSSPSELPADGEGTRRLYQELVALRRHLPWLHDGVVGTMHLDNRLLALRIRPRSAQGDDVADEIVVALSLEETEAWLPTAGCQGVLACAHGAQRPRPEGEGVVMPPMGWAVLS